MVVALADLEQDNRVNLPGNCSLISQEANMEAP